MLSRFSKSDVGRLVFSKFTALLLITALAMPLFLFSGWGAKAERRRKVRETPVVKHAPPEPFRINSIDETTSFRTNFTIEVASTIVSTLSMLGGADQPIVQDNTNQANGETKEERIDASTNTPIEENSVEETLPEETAETTVEETTPVVQPPTPTGTVDFDFDGDGKADIGRWHSGSTEFKVKFTVDGDTASRIIGTSGAKPAPGNFDNDNTYDAVVFSNGTWSGKYSDDGSTISESWGSAGDIPVVGDYDGGGESDFAYWRPSDGKWYIKTGEAAATPSPVAWGSDAAGDIPVVGDFDGDDKTDLSVFRNSTGDWWISKSSGGTLNKSWGTTGDIPVPADYDGDGITDIAIWRPSTGVWWVLTSDSNFVDYTTEQWGLYSDQPFPLDYDGDGEADLGIWRPSEGAWYINKSAGGSSAVAFGTPSDYAVPSAFVKQTGFQVNPDKMGEARLNRRNATGNTDLYSQNFSWSRGLVSLPGRSGLDLDLGIGYNSLVWTKVDLPTDLMYFDADSGTPTPGFQFGFPTIEEVFLNGVTSKFTYLMVTPSGKRVEFRETSVAGYFETADGSYAQLQTIGSTDPEDPADTLTIAVRTSDGTKASYSWIGGAFRCTQIKDRNGNYLTVAYGDRGELTSVTDTLGRVVTVNYTGILPTTITQTWKGTNGAGSNTTHPWATFTYANIDLEPNFGSGLAVAGPPAEYDIPVLEKITYADTSWTKFIYNDYGQVYKIENYADDNHKLNHVRTNLNTSGDGALAADQPDCPRFTKTWTWVENFNVGEDEEDEEILIENSEPTNDTYTVSGGSSQNTSVVEVEMPEHPDGLYQIMHFGRAGSWNEGLPIATRDCIGSSCAAEKRWTWTNWTQDNTGVAYPLNPRVTETRVGDGTNTKRTTIDYHVYDSPNQTVSKFGLPSELKTYKADLSTVMKRAVMDYSFSSTYLDRRIIGLPTETKTYGWSDGTSAEQYTSRTTYGYDADDDFDTEGLSQDIEPVQQDYTNFGPTFSAGRGNVTSVTRWDVTDDDNTALDIASEIKYNTAGSVVWQQTPWESSTTRSVKFVYDEATMYNDGVTNRATFAYPTRIYDPAGNYSEVKYRYDIGANVEAKSPAPYGNAHGKKTTREYDDFGRLKKNSIWRYASTWTEHAYTKYTRPDPDNGQQVFTHSTLVDVDGDNSIAEDEVTTETLLNGMGGVRMTRTDHPGSTGGYSAVLSEYDILGRVKRQSVPTEVNSDWEAVGDDAVRDFVWNSQEYDWMGRTTRSIPSDSNGSDGKDTLISYAGCGCAGGLITTVQGPLVPTDVDPQTDARRTQKSWADILGRTWKTQTYLWNGTTPYLTNEIAFNGRDQVLTVEQTDEDAEATQTSTMSYDGHGRVYQSHRPEQRDSSNNLKYTTYSYNPDGSILSMTDGRGVVTNYTYNNRGLLTNKAWNVGGTGVTDPADVAFTYDDAGNRLTMTDGLGTMAYTYNSLSQLKSETRDFTDSLADAPDGVFKLEYSYHIGGQLKSYIDPYGEEIVNSYDVAGRLSAVTGSSFAGVTTYANNPTYRAFGGLKHLDYGNDVEADITFDSSLRPTDYNLQKPGDASMVEKTYEYNKAGQLRLVEDGVSSWYDNSFEYDHQGRMTKARASTETVGTTVTNLATLPFRQDFGFNAFSNMTNVEGTRWTQEYEEPITFTNNRKQYGGYDADGRSLDDGQYYNAAGHIDHVGLGFADIERYYDGDGLEVKRTDSRFDFVEEEWLDPTSAYIIRSSVLGGAIVSEAGATGKKEQTFVYAGGTILARQKIQIVSSTPTEKLAWEHRDPGGTQVQYTGTNGAIVFLTGLESSRYDALGRMSGSPLLVNPTQNEANSPRFPSPLFEASIDLYNTANSPCQVLLDGIPTSCSSVPVSSLRNDSPDGRPAHERELPGMRFSMNLPGNEFGYNYFTGDFDEDENPIFGTQTTHFQGSSVTIGGWGSAIPTETESETPPTPVGGPCDISDILAVPWVSMAKNIAIAEQRKRTAYGIGVVGATLAPIGLVMSAGAAGAHATWFYSIVKPGGDWDYKGLDPVGNASGRSKYENFGNFHYGAVGAAAGFNRGKTLQRMGGLIQEADLRQPKQPGEHGGYANIIADFVSGMDGGEYPYKDEVDDQTMIERGIAYYNAGCHK